jgi:GT2 family glycosyltransferase
MARILVGIATVSPDQRFLESLPSFFRNVDSRHELSCKWVFNKELDHAQNELAEATLEGNYDYLLTIEDDHYGFTPEMLDALLEADTYVIGIPYHSRHYPFHKVPMDYRQTNKEGIRLFKQEMFTEGYHETDLVGFGFTLIKREVFEILDRPFFVQNKDRHTGCGPNATDMDFCLRLQEKGINPMGCWDFVLPHRDITEESWKEFTVKMINKKNSLFSYLNSKGVNPNLNLNSMLSQ